MAELRNKRVESIRVFKKVVMREVCSALLRGSIDNVSIDVDSYRAELSVKFRYTANGGLGVEEISVSDVEKFRDGDTDKGMKLFRLATSGVKPDSFPTEESLCENIKLGGNYTVICSCGHLTGAYEVLSIEDGRCTVRQHWTYVNKSQRSWDPTIPVDFLIGKPIYLVPTDLFIVGSGLYSVSALSNWRD